MSFSDIFVYAPFAFFALGCAAFVFRCGFRPVAKVLWAAWLLLACSKFFVARELGGSVFNPEFPAGLQIAWDVALLGALVLSAVSVPCFFRFRRKAVILPVFAWTVAAAGVWRGLALPGINEIELEFPGLPPSLDGYRIAQISDLHCSSAVRRWRTEGVVEKTNRIGADMICITGDSVDGFVEDRSWDLMPLKNLRARDGVYCVSGNHEYYRGWKRWIEWFGENGLKVLSNECVFPHPGLALGGVNDKAAPYYGDTAPDPGKVFAAAKGNEFRILLQHRPEEAVDNIRRYGVDLQLSGHTHGGVAPFIRSFVAKSNAGFVLGAYRIDGGVLYVSPGTGAWAGILSRFFNPSEITLITLRPAPAK
jgi:predicted MPP superfamily phosphohydrolase